MGKINKDIVEDTFIKKNTSIYELSILIGMDSFDYMVLDSQQKVLALRSYSLDPRLGPSASQLKTIAQEDKLLQPAYRNARAGFVSRESTLVPRRLFNEKEKRAYLEQSAQLESGVNVLADALPALDIYNIYALSPETEDFARASFPGARLFHLGTALLEGLRQHAARDQGHKVYAHIQEGLLYLLVFNSGELLYFNTFSYKSAKDFIYYLLLAFQQFGLKAKDVPAFFSGQLVEDSEIYREAQRYLGDIHFMKAPAFFKLGPKLSKEPQHLYFGLLSLGLCG